jgi:hypothetical protein
VTLLQLSLLVVFRIFPLPMSKTETSISYDSDKMARTPLAHSSTSAFIYLLQEIELLSSMTIMSAILNN